jgi:hypothetical protein
MGVGEETVRVFVRKPEDVRPLGKPRRRWEDNINGLKKYVGVDFIYMA